MINLREFNFPDLQNESMVLSTEGTNQQLLNEAIQRGFYDGDTEYNKLFSKLFFKGGELKFKKDLDESFKSRIITYLKHLMYSLSPSHEDKEAVCAMLLSEVVDIDAYKE